MKDNKYTELHTCSTSIANLSTKGACVATVLLNFDLLDILSEGGTISRAIFPSDANLPGALGLNRKKINFIYPVGVIHSSLNKLCKKLEKRMTDRNFYLCYELTIESYEK